MVLPEKCKQKVMEGFVLGSSIGLRSLVWEDGSFGVLVVWVFGVDLSSGYVLHMFGCKPLIAR